MHQVLSISWGAAYGPDYVNRLYGMVARNMREPFTFFCMTDRTEGLRPEVEALPFPDLPFSLARVRHGIWDKSRLWRADLGGPAGPVLFLDLDIVVTSDLTPFFHHGDPDDVILARNPNTPFEKLGQTSIYRFPVGKLTPLWDTFAADPEGVAAAYKFEQRFVTRNSPGGVSFWPKPWVKHFRHHCARPFPMNFLREPRLPADARVVLFAGGLNPPDAIAGRWNREMPVMTPADHARAAFGPAHRGARFRHLRHYVKPTSWVAEHWRA